MYNKFNKILILIILSILILVSLNFATASENLTDADYTFDLNNLTSSNTVFINNSYNGNVEDGSQAHPYKTINTGINNAIKNSKPNIYIANGEYNINKVITVRDSTLNIIGESNNVILNANGNSNFFKFLDGSYSLYNLILANGEPTSNRRDSLTYGGAIYINASGDGGYKYRKQTLPFELFSLKIVNCVFKNNQADYGGAIYGINGNLIIINSTFYSNSAIEGGAINFEYCNITIFDTNFYKNSASYGGALYLTVSLNNIYNSKIDENDAFDGAGAYIEGGILNIENSEFNKNIAEGDEVNGGALFISQSQSNINNSIFHANEVTGDVASASAIYSETASTLIIDNSIISSNTLSGDYAFGVIVNKGFLTVKNSQIYENSINSENRIDEVIYNINGIVKTENTEITRNTFKGVKKLESLYSLNYPIITGKLYDEDTYIPSKYDLRNITLSNGSTVSWVTSVKSQGSLGTCWAFGTLGALESYLKMKEGVEYDFSELNMNNLADWGNEGYDSYEYADGGDFYTAVAYLTRWSGPVNETDDPYESNSKSSKNISPVKHVQDIVFIPLRENFTDLNQIKIAMLKYGAIAVAYASTDYEDNLESYENSPNFYEPLSQISNHIVLLVGWDDNYSKHNFKSRYGEPAGDGAFIIKNSWDVDNGEDGYNYISYYDATFGGFDGSSCVGLAFSNVEEVDNYKDKYEYDTLGSTGSFLGFNNETAWFANVFVAKSNNPLAAFSIITSAPKSTYYAKIYVNNELKLTTEGTIDEIGYHTIKLDNNVPLSIGDTFKIIVKLTTPGFYFPIAIETNIEDFSSNAHAQSGQSFISANGEKWYDISQNRTIIENSNYGFAETTLTESNVCLKAFTVSTNTTFLSCDEFVSIYGEIRNLTGKLTDMNGNPILGQHIKLKLSRTTNNQSKIYDVVTDYNGIYNLEIHLAPGLYTAKANYDGYKEYSYSSSLLTNVLVKRDDKTLTKISLENYTSTVKYGIPVKFIAKLTTADNLALNNEEVDITLIRVASGASKTYTLITNNNGEFYLNIGLAIGEYLIQCSYKGTNIYDSSRLECNLVITS